MLGLDATLDAGYGLWEHLHSLREVKGLEDCMVYKTLRLPIILYVEHGAVVMTAGSQSGGSQFETYG